MTKYYVHEDGSYIGGYDGAEPPSGAIEVPTAPDDARQIWDFNNSVWLPLPPQPYQLGMDEFWMRMTDAEAEIFDAAMNTANPLRLRRVFRSAMSMTQNSELFNFTVGVLTTSLGASRAAAISAAPDPNFYASVAPDSEV